jgi:hypothetical protein
MRPVFVHAGWRSCMPLAFVHAGRRSCMPAGLDVCGYGALM